MPSGHGITFSTLDWLVLLAYLGLMFFIGHWAARKRTDAEGYFLGQRKMPTWAVTLSVVATTLSVATFIGAPEASFKGDLTYLSVNIGYILAAFVVAGLFIPKLYAAGTMTIYGYLGKRFGPGAVVGASATFLLGRLLASGARLFVAAIPICLLMFGSFSPTKAQLIQAILLIGAIGTAYTVAGGIKAVIWTDTAQILIVLGTAVLTIFLLLSKIPLGVAELWHLLGTPGTNGAGSKLLLIDTSFDMRREFTIWTAILGATFLGAASTGTDHDVAQRMLTTQSKAKAVGALIASQFITTILQVLFVMIGLLLWVFYRRPDVMGSAAPADPVMNTQQVYPQFLLYHLPAGLRGLAIAGMFAAAQGSLDSAINAMASSAVADVYWPLLRRMGLPVETGQAARSPRIAVLLIGLLLIGFAVGSALLFDSAKGTLIGFALGIMAYAFTGLLGVYLTALLTKRGNSASAIAALVAGVVVTGALSRYTPLAGFWRMPIGACVCFLICFAGKPRHDGGEVVR